MKKFTYILLFFLFAFAIQILNAQSWMKSIKSPKPSFREIQKAFYESHQNVTPKHNDLTEKPNEAAEDGEYEKFKRWEWFWEPRVGKDGQFPPYDVLWKELASYQQTHSTPHQEFRMGAANWSFKGPSTSVGGYYGIGRINCVAFHPTDANTFWVGTPAGGIWKTIDGGTTWTTSTDNLPVLGVSDIAVDYTNPNILYIATGDGEPVNLLLSGNGNTRSVGVLKSTDGGTTWNMTGLNWSVTSQKLIRRLLIHPSDPQILIAAASDGVWRTADGGANWSLQQAGYFIDMEFKPTDPNYVYGATSDTSGNAQIYTSVDAGITWGQVTSLQGITRINLAVSANSPNAVEAVGTDTASVGGFAGLWHSSNSGASFAQYDTGTCVNNMLGWNYDGTGCTGQGDYDLSFSINPSNANEIWIGGVNDWVSKDGGNTWSLATMWTGYPPQNPNSAPVVHADKHFFAFNPLNNYLYECNDGGIYVTTDGGLNWQDKSNGLGISEFYRIGVANTVADRVVGGLQDNGSRELKNGLWYNRTGGDGMQCLIDPTNANIQYASYVNGVIYRTANDWTSYFPISDSIPGKPTGAWVTPFVLDPVNPAILYAGYNDVYKTRNRGNSWAKISNQLTSGSDTSIISVAAAATDTGTVYAATKFKLYKTTDGGTTWDTIRTSVALMTYIAVKPTNSQILWVTSSGYTAGDKVWMSADGGTSWTNFSGTLPNIPVNCIVYQKGTGDGLYIGTDLGVFYRDSSMTDWIPYNIGLPNVIVNDLQISFVNNKLWAATYGRGLWSSDLYSVTGINDQDAHNYFSIYPNPNNGEFVVNVTAVNPATFDISVFNVLGEKVWERKQNHSRITTIDLSNTVAGVYFVQLNFPNGGMMQKMVMYK